MRESGPRPENQSCFNSNSSSISIFGSPAKKRPGKHPGTTARSVPEFRADSKSCRHKDLWLRLPNCSLQREFRLFRSQSSSASSPRHRAGSQVSRLTVGAVSSPGSPHLPHGSPVPPPQHSTADGSPPQRPQRAASSRSGGQRAGSRLHAPQRTSAEHPCPPDP